MIAALYVARGGAYFGLPDVDPWDEARDARLYAGPWPVVAHPPCQRWCQLAGLNQKLFGYRVGDDAGCFAAALAAVRRWGGVLEHPAFSRAWKAHALHAPSTAGGWTNADFEGGWTCHVEQGHYGHSARKATWLYAVSPALPALRWGPGPIPTATVSNMRNHGGGNLERIVQRRADASPPAFRDALIGIAKARAALGEPAPADPFACCGGNDEKPPYHCSDCPDHPWNGEPDPRCMAAPHECPHAKGEP